MLSEEDFNAVRDLVRELVDSWKTLLDDPPRPTHTFTFKNIKGRRVVVQAVGAGGKRGFRLLKKMAKTVARTVSNPRRAILYFWLDGVFYRDEEPLKFPLDVTVQLRYGVRGATS